MNCIECEVQGVQYRCLVGLIQGICRAIQHQELQSQDGVGGGVLACRDGRKGYSLHRAVACTLDLRGQRSIVAYIVISNRNILAQNTFNSAGFRVYVLDDISRSIYRVWYDSE